MNRLFQNIVLLLTSVTLLLGACRKKPDPVAVPQVIGHGGANAGDGHLKVVFENVAGAQSLVLNTGSYVNEAGNTFSVSAYKYYISNIKLWKADSSYFAESESYHLVDEALGSSKSFFIHDIPVGDYQSISFLVGVDYDRNISGAQTGALDPLNAMFWDWNTGYIMAKIEGTSPGITGGIAFHIGGFDGLYSAVRPVNLALPVAARVNGATTPKLHLRSDVLEWFKTPNLINFSDVNIVVTTGQVAVRFADNYQDMFTVDHVEN
jgi:hypothetical protein